MEQSWFWQKYQMTSHMSWRRIGRLGTKTSMTAEMVMVKDYFELCWTMKTQHSSRSNCIDLRNLVVKTSEIVTAQDSA